MKILIIGSGGREHALAWKAAQSPGVTKVYVAPGNAGTAQEPHVENIAFAVTDVPGLLQFAEQQNIDLTLVGPEAALAVGVVDTFKKANRLCFGPTQAAAQLESSKAFAKHFMQRHHIPTARYACFDAVEPALTYLREQTYPIVIKADGLAQGKGVVIATTYAEAAETVTDMLSGQRFGQAGKRVVIEQFLEGEEISFIVITDGIVAKPLASSQDHKRRDTGDQGPNTGGMGAYSPVSRFTPALEERVMQTIVLPTLAGMRQEGNLFQGFLYVGLMITPAGDPSVLEFNTRLGDPETQPLLFRLSSDLVTLCQATLTGHLAEMTLEFSEEPAVGIVIASKGYPEQPQLGTILPALPPDTAHTKIFHAGTTCLPDGTVSVSGGRVLTVTSKGESLQLARQRALETAEHIVWPTAFFRQDIGWRDAQ